MDQNIIHYAECNEMLKKATLTSNDLVKRGMICAYKDQGKDSCQVSACLFLGLRWQGPSSLPPPLLKTVMEGATLLMAPEVDLAWSFWGAQHGLKSEICLCQPPKR